MGNRRAFANDPKLLARIAEQEDKRGASSALGLSGSSLTSSPSASKAPRASRAHKVAIANQDSRHDEMRYDEETNTLTILLAGAKLLSLNVALRTHDAQLTQLKRTWLKRAQALMLEHRQVYESWKLNQVSGFPFVVEEVYATDESHRLDVESVVASCKPIIDALVKVGFIPDDGPDFIAQPIAYTFKQKNGGLVLVFRPGLKPWGAIRDSTMAVAASLPERMP